ncbi:unnamed protein product [Orchesella dallaii]|uniref:Uncharacterized protein n=1 Tax=Orchesella dallaii TaxID=48710 RepID=A0ABP1REY0_9HEXA
MGLSPVIVVLAFGVMFIAVAMLWWLRYSEKKTVIRQVTRHPQPYLGQLANNIYHIPLSRNYIYQTPPPTFSKAVKFPRAPQRVSINIAIEELPPPTYDEYLNAQKLASHVSVVCPN